MRCIAKLWVMCAKKEVENEQWPNVILIVFVFVLNEIVPARVTEAVRAGTSRQGGLLDVLQL